MDLLDKLIKTLIPNPVSCIYRFQKIMFFLIRFPCYSSEFIKKNVTNRAENPHNERQIFEYFMPTSCKSLMIFMFVYCIYISKNLLFLYLNLASFDYNEPEQNLIKMTSSATGGKYYQFACVETNCSRLSSSSLSASASSSGQGGQWLQADEMPHRALAQDLIQLPLIAMCQPRLRKVLHPIESTHIIGLLYVAVETFLYFCVCILLPIYQLIVLTPYNAMMFAFCPTISRNLARQRLEAFLMDLTISSVNFEKNNQLASHSHWQKSILCHGEAAGASFDGNYGHGDGFKSTQPFGQSEYFQRLPTTTTTTTTTMDKTHHNEMSQSMKRLIKLKEHEQLGRHLGPHLERYLDDCLPIHLSDWWRLRWSQAYMVSLVAVGFTWCFILTFYQIFLNENEVASYRATLGSYSEFVRKNNCTLWNGTSKIIKLEQWLDHWSLFDIFHRFAVMFAPVFILVSSVNNFYQAMNDLKLQVIELNCQLSVAIEFAELRQLVRRTNIGTKCHKDKPLATLISSNSYHNEEFRMQCLRERLYECIDYTLAILWLRPMARANRKPSRTHLDNRLAIREFALEMLVKFGASDRVYVELLEKIQVHYWHMKRSIEEESLPVMNVLVVCYVANYGLAFIFVYMHRRIRDLGSIPLAMTLASLTTVNILISWASSVHAHGNKLEPMFWSLIALNEQLDDIDGRISHLRSLWIKQLSSSGHMGTVGLQVLGFKITYVNIIHVMIWTATITLLAFVHY